MTNRFALVLALVLVSGTAFAQNGPQVSQATSLEQQPRPGKRFEEVPPTVQVDRADRTRGQSLEAPAREQAPKVDPAVIAKQKFATWSDVKLACYRKITGAPEGRYWRVNPDNPGDIQTHSSLWDLSPAITGAFAKCKAMKPGEQ